VAAVVVQTTKMALQVVLAAVAPTTESSVGLETPVDTPLLRDTLAEMVIALTFPVVAVVVREVPA
jgi:hypothetical protein